MHEDPKNTIQTMRAGKAHGRRISAGTRLLGLAVVFLVFYALSLPALTEENAEAPPAEAPLIVCDLESLEDPSLYCGLEAHVHTEACYEYVSTGGEISEGEASAPATGGDEVSEGEASVPATGGGETPESEASAPATGGGEVSEGEASAPATSGAALSFDSEATTEATAATETTEATETTATTEAEAATEAAATETRERVLVCGLEEHVHSASCYEAPLRPMMRMLSNGRSSELADFLDNIVITDADGKPINPDTDNIHAGETYVFTLSFKEENNAQFEYENGKLTYQLPDEIDVAANSGDIAGVGGVVIGHYTIDADGSVEVWFLEVDKYGNSITPKNFIDYYTNVSFTLRLETQFNVTGGTEPIEINFDGYDPITLTVEPDTYLTVTKTAGSYNHATRTIDYTVTVTPYNVPDGYAISGIMLIDVMDIKNTQYSVASALLTDCLTIPDPVTISWPTSNTYTNQVSVLPNSLVDNHGGWYEIPLAASMNDAVQLGNGETATVTYSVLVDDDLLTALDPSDPSDTKRLNGNGYTLENEVTATGYLLNLAPGTLDDDPIEDDAKATVQFSVTHLNKEGVLNDSIANGGNNNGKADPGEKMTWTITVGDGASDLSGVPIVDTLTSGHTILANTITVWLYATVAEATAYPYGGTQYVYDGSPNNAASLLSPTPPTGGFTLTVPDNIGRVGRVVIQYTTEAGASSGGYGNEVSFTYPDGRGTYSHEAFISKIHVEKTGELIENDSGGGEDRIEYTVIIDVPGGLQGHSVAIIDGLTFSWDVVENKPTVNVAITDLGGTEIDEDEYDWKLLYSDKEAEISTVYPHPHLDPFQHFWYMQFGGEDGKNLDENDSENRDLAGMTWPTDDPRVITLTYSIPLATPVLAGTYAGKTLGAALESGGAAINVAQILVDGIVNGSDDYLLYKPILKRAEKTYHNGTGWVNETTYSVAGTYSDDGFNLATEKGYLYTVILNPQALYAPFDLAPAQDKIPPLFSDDFDSRLALNKVKNPPVQVEGVVISVNGTNSYCVDPVLVIPTPDSPVPGRTSFELDFSANLSLWEWHNDGSGWNSTTAVITWDENYTYTLQYRLLIKNVDALDPNAKFTNTASITIKDSSSQSRRFDAEAEVYYSKKLITKEMYRDTGTTVNVEIVVNPGGDDLSPGDDANLNQPGDDTITVVDTMSPTLAFENISEIKVTYIDDPDAGGDVPYGSLTYDPAQNAVTFAGLPDEKAIRIAYTAVVIGETGEAGEKVDISNTVEIAGYADSKTEVTQKFTVMDSSASGAGEKASFYVRKTDSTDDSALAGARFALYIEGEYTGWDDPILHPLPEGAAQTITEGEGPEAKTYYYLMSPGPTGADGKASFQDEGWIKQGDNYLLVEIEAPPGYIGLEEPLLLHISYEGEDTSTVPSGASLIANNGILTVTNEPGIRFPETGGGGAGPYAATGAAIMALALLLIGRRRRRPFDDGT